MRRALPHVIAVAALTLLAGCGDRMAGRSPAPAAPARATPPPTDMAGRWTFSAAGTSCVMNFGGAQGAEGAIRPEGGCPGNFFTSRKWTFESGDLILRDHNSAPLAQLKMLSPGRFEGQSASGQPMSLAR